MSERVELLRRVIADHLDALEAGEPLADTEAALREAWDRTAFVAPALFPALAVTKDAIPVTLLGVVEKRLIGAYRDDDGDLVAGTWSTDGLYYGLDDPSDFDLTLPEAAPLPPVAS